MMDLRHLGHLLALAEERHFARAAQRVHLSQPAFSRSIQALERHLGLQLFERGGGDIRPTPAGEFLVQRARALLFDARCVDRDVALYRDAQLGDTAFGVGPFPAATLVNRVLPDIRSQHPDVSLRVEVSNWDQLLERLRREDIEFFVADIRSLPQDATLHIQALGRQVGRFYVRAAHPLDETEHTLAQVWAYGVASTRLPRMVKDVLAQLLGLPAGQVPPIALECDDVHILRALAQASDTVLAGTDVAVQSDVASGTLRALNIAKLPPLYSAMGIVRLAQRTPSPMAQRLMTAFALAAGEVNEGANPP